jgi:hypothetical protein
MHALLAAAKRACRSDARPQALVWPVAGALDDGQTPGRPPERRCGVSSGDTVPAADARFMYISVH